MKNVEIVFLNNFPRLLLLVIRSAINQCLHPGRSNGKTRFTHRELIYQHTHTTCLMLGVWEFD